MPARSESAVAASRRFRLHDLGPPADAGPPLHVGIVGGVTLAAGAHVLPLAHRKARGLVAYLAVNGAAASREALAGLFWSESSEHQARNSLRQVLFELREALGAAQCAGVLVAERDTVGLRPGAVRLDFDDVLSDIAEGRAIHGRLPHTLRAESLLAGYEDLGTNFSDWMAAVRASLFERLMRALQRAYSDQAASRPIRRGLAEVVLGIDPLQEEACRTVMRLAAEDGETSVALRCYARLYDQLGVELDMEPSEPTQALVAAIKRGDLVPALAPPPASRPTVPAIPGGPPTVAVLPFRTTGKDLVAGQIAEGVAEDIAATLAALREPIVLSPSSTRVLHGHDADPAAAALERGATYFVTGAVQHRAGHVHISAELIDAASGAVIWAKAYESSAGAVFDTQARIAATLAQTLSPRLSEAELSRTRQGALDHIGAYHLLLRARELVARLEPESFKNAGELLHRAARLDPRFAPVHAAMADWYSLRIFEMRSLDRDGDWLRLEQATRSALQAQPGHARARAIFGHNLAILDRRYDEALDHLECAAKAAPHDAEVQAWCAPALAYAGRPDDAMAHAARAISLSPDDPFVFRYESFLAIAHYVAGDYESTVRWGRRSTLSNPNYAVNLRFTAAALVALGRTADAAPLVRRVRHLAPDFRASGVVERNPFPDPADRVAFAERLIQAGLPP